VGASNGRPVPRDGVAVRLAPRHRGGLVFRSARAWASLARLRATEGRKDAPPLDRARRLPTKAHERLDMRGDTKPRGCSPPATPGRGPHGLARQGDRPEHPRHHRPHVARDFVAQLGIDLQNESCPPEGHSLGRTLRRWYTSPRGTRPRSPTARPKRPTTRSNGSSASASRSAGSATIGSGHCSTPGDPTGHYSPRSHPAESEEPVIGVKGRVERDHRHVNDGQYTVPPPCPWHSWWKRSHSMML
jgi:hypothetical protein